MPEFAGYAGSGLFGYAGSGLGDVPTEWATPAQKERLAFLAEQLHALGLSVGQAMARGDDVAVAQLRPLIVKLTAEYHAIQEAVIARANQGQQAAESGAYDSPLERFSKSVTDAVKKIGLVGALALGVGAFLYFGRR